MAADVDIVVYIVDQIGAVKYDRGRIEAKAASGYVLRLTNGVASITCLVCGMTSHHPQDVAQRYCGHCHVFHEGE